MPDQTGQDPNQPTFQADSSPIPTAIPAATPSIPNDNITVGLENVETPPPPIVTDATLPQSAVLPTQDYANDGASTPIGALGMPPVVTSGSLDGNGNKGKKAVKLVATILSAILLIGGVGVGVYLVQQQQDIREKAAGDCSGCGVEPDFDSFNKVPSTIGPFPEKGKLVIYWDGIEVTDRTTLTFNYNGQQHNVDVSGDRQRLVTDIEVEQGNSVTLVQITHYATSVPSCAPDQNPPYYAWGWMGVNQDNSCGSGLPGPPTGGQCLPMQKYSVSDAMSWADDYGEPVLSRQCWADWREWPGDYDFNDYFIQFSLEPTGRPSYCVSSTVNQSTISLGESVTVSSVSNTPISYFFYSVYNSDNVYAPGNPKPVCVTSGGDVTSVQGNCPSGTYQLIFKDPNENARTSGSRTVAYESLFVQDQNSGSRLVNAQINAYFSDGGEWSLPDANCVTYISSEEGGSALCLDVRAYSVEGSVSEPTNWTRLSASQLSDLQPGDTIYITAAGSSTTPELPNGGFDQGVFSVNGTELGATRTFKPKSNDDPEDVFEIYDTYVIPADTTSFDFDARIHYAPSDMWF